MKIKRLFNFFHTPTWLFFLLLLILILRIPSLFEPYSYGDEMIYLTLGQGIRKGLLLYKEIYDNKPPLIYLLAAISGNLFWFKAILAIWNLLTIYFFWRLTLFLFPKSQKASAVATTLFALFTTLPLLEGNIVNAEIFMIGPTILAFFLIFFFGPTPTIIFISGILFSVSTLFKVPAIFDLPVILFFWLLTFDSKKQRLNLSSYLKRCLYLFAGFLIPIILLFIWSLSQNLLAEMFNASFSQNIGYLSSWRPADTQKPFLIRNAPLLLRALVLVLSLTIIFINKNKFSKTFIFASSWLLFSLFAATLSERPYPHYLIQVTPSFVILLSIFLTSERKEQVYSLLPVTLLFLAISYFNFWYYPTVPYYRRFLKLATGNISRQDYLSSFGNQVLRNYKIADFIKNFTDPKEKVFIWGEASPIYALSDRLPPIKYVVDYHIRDLAKEEEVIETLKKNPPRLIVKLPEAPNYPLLDVFLEANYAKIQSIDQANIFVLLKDTIRGLKSF